MTLLMLVPPGVNAAADADDDADDDYDVKWKSPKQEQPGAGTTPHPVFFFTPLCCFSQFLYLCLCLCLYLYLCLYSS